DHGEQSWRGAGRLSGCIALITGGDSGIGRAVAIAYAREGCDLVIGHLAEDGDAEDTAELLRAEGREVLVVRSDLSTRAGCLNLVDQAVNRFGRIDILVNNAAHQEHFDK